MSYAYYIKISSYNERSKKKATNRINFHTCTYLVNIISDIFLYIYSDKKRV